jgi:hypothetical protein
MVQSERSARLDARSAPYREAFGRITQVILAHLVRDLDAEDILRDLVNWYDLKELIDENKKLESVIERAQAFLAEGQQAESAGGNE